MYIRAVARRDAEDEKLHKIRSASLSASLFANVVLKTRSERSPKASWSVSGAARERFWTAPEHSWPAWGVPRSALGHHVGVQKTSRARPDASPKRPWAPKPAQDQFFFDLGWIFVDFRKIFRRFSLAPRATKAQNRISKRSRAILTARLGPCVTQSLRTARTSFEMACERYMFSPFSLRTHKPT